MSPDPSGAISLKLFLLLALTATLAGCGEGSRPPVLPGRSGAETPDQESWDATITFTDSGRVKGILRAGHIAKFTDDRFTILDSGIVVDFYNDSFEHTSVLTARRGRINDVSNDFEARGDVVVRSDSGTVLKTEELFWNNQRGRVFTEAFVEISSPTEMIRGIGLESDQSLTNYKINRVTGKVQPK